MVAKKESKTKTKGAGGAEIEAFGKIASSADLKAFLQNILDRLKEDVASPIYIAGAMNHVLSLPDIYTLLDNENRELARDLWLRLKQAGLQLRNPPLLFSEGDGVVEGTP